DTIEPDCSPQPFDVAQNLDHLIMHGNARATGRIVEEQAHRCDYELVMPATEIRDVLPAVVGLQRLDRARQAPGAVVRLHPGPAVHARGLLALPGAVTCSSPRT